MSHQIETNPPAGRASRLRGALVAAGVVLLLGLVGYVYGVNGRGKEGPALCQETVAKAARIDPLIHGDVAALSLTSPPKPLADLSFLAGDDSPRTMADFKGKTVLLNLWASWCVPCRKEMPALDRLQAKLGGPDFQVLAVNIDTAKLDRPRQFLHDVGVTNLPFYADPTAKVFQTLRENGPVVGLPTTFLVDKNGCAMAVMSGPAEWDSVDAEKMIEAAKS